MMRKRERHALGWLNGQMYAVGGGDKIWQCVERCDPAKNTWTFVAPMNLYSRRGHGVATASGFCESEKYFIIKI